MNTIEIVSIVFWAVIFVATLIYEIQSFNLTTIWFCISAFVVLILAVFKVSITIQAIVFISLSIILLIATKPLVKKIKDKEPVPTNTDRIIGKTAVVTKEISKNNYGEIVVDNNLWRAVSKDDSTILVDEEVIIEGITGVKVIVSRK